MGLVLTIVNRFNPKNLSEKESYIQAGRIGLWKALIKFSEKKGSKFSPYAWNPIKWEIIKEIRSVQTKTFSLSGGDCIDSNEQSTLRTTSIPFWEYIPSSLNENESEVIYLRLEGYNFKEISKKLNRHRSSIKKIFQNAIKKIRETNNE